MENSKAEALLQAAIKCDAAMGQEDKIASLVRKMIDGASTTARMSLLWTISDVSGNSDANVRLAIQELHSCLMDYQ